MNERPLQLADFTPYLNQSFTIQVSDGAVVTALLVEAEALTGIFSLEDSPRDPFSLIFKLEEGAEMIQRMYDVRHGETVWRDMFLVPIHAPRQGRFMQAIFN